MTYSLMVLSRSVLAASLAALVATGCSSSLQPVAATGGSGGQTVATGGTAGQSAAGGGTGGQVFDAGGYDAPPAQMQGPDGGLLCRDRLSPTLSYLPCCPDPAPGKPDCSTQPDGYPFYTCISQQDGYCTCNCSGGKWTCGC